MRQHAYKCVFKRSLVRQAVRNNSGIGHVTFLKQAHRCSVLFCGLHGCTDSSVLLMLDNPSLIFSKTFRLHRSLAGGIKVSFHIKQDFCDVFTYSWPVFGIWKQFVGVLLNATQINAAALPSWILGVNVFQNMFWHQLLFLLTDKLTVFYSQWCIFVFTWCFQRF